MTAGGWRVGADGDLIVERHDTAASFLAASEEFLLAREAEHCLLLGICGGLPEDTLAGDGPWLATATAGGVTVGVGPLGVVRPGPVEPR